MHGFSSLNARSIPDAYPLPRINTDLDRLRDAKYISSLDLKDVYWQMPMDEGSRKYTAFSDTLRAVSMASYAIWLTLGSCHLPIGSRYKTRYGTIRFRLSRRHHRDWKDVWQESEKSQGGVWETQGSKSKNKYRKMRVVQDGDPIPRPHCDELGYKILPRENCRYRTTHYTTRYQRSSPVFGDNFVVPTFCPELCQNLSTVEER